MRAQEREGAMQREGEREREKVCRGGKTVHTQAGVTGGPKYSPTLTQIRISSAVNRGGAGGGLGVGGEPGVRHNNSFSWNVFYGSGGPRQA